MAGTPNMRRAVDWAVEAFRAAGVDQVGTENFTMPSSWREGATEIAVTAPLSFSVRGASSAWSPATGAEGIEAQVLDGGSGSEGRIRRMGKKARGKILLIRSEQVLTFLDLANEQRDATIASREAAEVGAAALLFTSTRANGLLYRHINSINGKLDPLPSALIGREDGLRILRLLEAGKEVRMRLSMPNQIGGPFQASNVVAEIRGREKPGEFVILGGHLDSWDLGTGCLDNGCNIALVIEVARAIAAARLRPRRSIRFILFNGEEQGLFGSRGYVEAHRAELDSIATVMIHDMGVGKIRGYSLGGRHGLKEGLAGAMKPIEDRGANEHTIDAFFGTDHFDFLLEGIPALVAVQDTSQYVPVYHSSADTFDKVSIRDLHDRTSIAAVTAYNIADRPERIGKRFSRKEVERLLEDTRLDDQLKFLDLWDEWKDGRRGRGKHQSPERQ
jgi:carboxypeptidase Q